MTYGSSSYASVAYASLTGTRAAVHRPFRPPIGFATLVGSESSVNSRGHEATAVAKEDSASVTSQSGSATFTPTRG